MLLRAHGKVREVWVISTSESGNIIRGVIDEIAVVDKVSKQSFAARTLIRF